MNARDPLLPLQPDEATALAAFANRRWDEAIVPALVDYIGVPAKSPMFDAEWQQHGHIDRVVRDAAAWDARIQAVINKYDGELDDELGQLGLVEADYEWITRRLKDLADRHCGGRIVSCLEGGYALGALARSVAVHLRVLADV